MRGRRDTREDTDDDTVEEGGAAAHVLAHAAAPLPAGGGERRGPLLVGRVQITPERRGGRGGRGGIFAEC